MLTLLSCGSNAQGQLGNGTLDDSQRFLPCSFANHPPGTLPPHTVAVLDVATGANHTLILLKRSDGKKEIWGCGDGRKGQLGSAYQQHTSTTIFHKLDLSLELRGQDRYSFGLIGATWETSYIVLVCEGGRNVVLAMGSDDFGDLGASALKGKKKSNLIFFDDVTALYTGQRHVVLRFGSSRLVGWGSSRHGQLGDAAAKPFSAYPQVISPPSDSEEPVKSVSLGMQHTVVMYDSGRLCTFGSNRKHQLDVATAYPGHVFSLACTWNGTYLAFKEEDGNWGILSSGSNSHSQLGRSTEDFVGRVSFPTSGPDTQLNHSVSLHAGSEHVLAVVSGREVWGWGWNEHGNLGVGHTDDIPTPTKIWPHDQQSGIIKVHGTWGGMGTSWICAETPAEHDAL